jgi:hypothetical protein
VTVVVPKSEQIWLSQYASYLSQQADVVARQGNHVLSLQE